MWRRGLVAAAFLLLPLEAFAGHISLQWDASPTAGVTYNVYWGTSSGNHPNSASAGTQTTYTVPNLTNGVRYYFVVRAVAGGVLSVPSNEVNGLPGSSLSFTDNPLVSGVHSMKLLHMTELRRAINAARAARGLTQVSWTTIGVGSLIRASHLNEMRTALNPVYQSFGLPLPTYVEPINVGTPIKALHIMELRTLVAAVSP